MTNPVIEPVCETADELWADDELSDEALDRAAGQGGKLSSPNRCGGMCIVPCGGSPVLVRPGR